MMRPDVLSLTLTLLTPLVACQPQTDVRPGAAVDASQQLVVVTTSGWTATVGRMTRFERATPTSAWRRVDAPIPLVVGRTGIAWGVGFDNVSSEGPHKREGDGKAPAGIFALDTTFGFAPRESMANVRLPYVQLLPATDCVDDTASVHYNTVVDRRTVARVDWNSAEHMREVPQYKIGVIVSYNSSPPVKARGSCIFLHIWAGPNSHTAGCTAFDEAKLREVMQWLDPQKRPVMVQLTDQEFQKLQASWRLPTLE